MSLEGMEQRYDELYGHIAQMLVAADVDTGRIVWCNRAFLDATLDTGAELVGRDVLQIVHPDARSSLQNLLTSSEATEARSPQALRVLRKDGSELAVELRVGTVRTGDALHVHLAMTDRGTDELDRFLYAASHDLKSPLVTAQGFSGLLLQKLQETGQDEARGLADFVDGSIRRMGRMIDDLLALSRAGRSLTPEPIDTRELVGNLLEELGLQLRTAGAEVEVKPDLPSVCADRASTHRMLEELVKNALEHGCGNDGQTANTIVIHGERRGHRVHLGISDGGPGIDPRFHDRAFQVFQRLTRAPGGTGVGLALVAKLARRHGGRAWIESDGQRGATFWVELPAHSTIESE